MTRKTVTSRCVAGAEISAPIEKVKTELFQLTSDCDQRESYLYRSISLQIKRAKNELFTEISLKLQCIFAVARFSYSDENSFSPPDPNSSPRTSRAAAACGNHSIVYTHFLGSEKLVFFIFAMSIFLHFSSKIYKNYPISL